MRILYHHRTASKDGQAVHIEEMISALRALGHEVRVVAPGASDPGKMGGKVGWIHQLRRGLPKGIYELLELAYSWVAYRRLLRQAKEFKPDFVYERYNLFLLAGAMLKRRLRIPLLLEVNSPLVEERSSHGGGLALPWLARWAEGTAWRAADCVLPVTGVLAGYVRAYGVPDERIVVIPNGINEAHFSAAPSQAEAKTSLGLEGKLVLGFVGFVREWHGVDRIVRWMARRPDRLGLHLLIVGDGPVREELEELARQLGLRDQITFTGVVDREDVPKYLAAFDVALQPAVVSYASPLKLIEYLAMGKAIVAPRMPNLLEVLTDGENALLFDDQNGVGMEQVLDMLCRDMELRQRIASGALHTIERLNLRWAGNAEKVVGLIEKVPRN